VFADIQAVWRNLFQSQITTACGSESAEVSPFYCSDDRTVYLDLQFFTSMAKQFGVTGDFAEAYVVAREVGHHIQNLTGITGRIAAADQSSPSAGNALSVGPSSRPTASQASGRTAPRSVICWMPATSGRPCTPPRSWATITWLAPVDPDSWTHGSSAQRQKWFTSGYQDGRPDACDTFAAASP
jgi:uncharacterized protein